MLIFFYKDKFVTTLLGLASRQWRNTHYSLLWLEPYKKHVWCSGKCILLVINRFQVLFNRVRIAGIGLRRPDGGGGVISGLGDTPASNRVRLGAYQGKLGVGLDQLP
jgi:hypothetical protein